MVPAQCREQDLPLDRHGRRGRDRKDGRFAEGPVQAAICDARHPERRFSRAKAQLETGDIVGFVSRRPNLDYFHAGFVAFARDRTLLLRHASESRHRVLDERMDRFVAHNRVRYVTLLRPKQPAAAVAVKKAI